MKSFLVFIVSIIALSYEIITSVGQEVTSEKNAKLNEETPGSYVFSLLPLRIMLEHQLIPQGELREVVSENPKLKSKSEPVIKSSNPTSSESLENATKSENVCELPIKNLSLSQISQILIGGHSIEEHSFNKEELQNIYDALKNCFFVRVRSAKLFGPAIKWEILFYRALEIRIKKIFFNP